MLCIAVNSYVVSPYSGKKEEKNQSGLNNHLNFATSTPVCISANSTAYFVDDTSVHDQLSFKNDIK